MTTGVLRQGTVGYTGGAVGVMGTSVLGVVVAEKAHPGVQV